MISAAGCYEHTRKEKEKGVPWGGVRMLRRCEAGKETSGREIRGGEEQEMRGGGGMWVRSDVRSGHNRRWEWCPDAGDGEDEKTTSDASGRGARASDAGLIVADVVQSIIVWIFSAAGWMPSSSIIWPRISSSVVKKMLFLGLA